MDARVKEFQAKVGGPRGRKKGRGCVGRAQLSVFGRRRPGLACLLPAPTPQISAHRGNLTAVRRQLDTAHAEQASLAGQLRAGLATAGAAGGPEAPVTPAIVKELTHRHETEQHATQNEIAEVRRRRRPRPAAAA